MLEGLAFQLPANDTLFFIQELERRVPCGEKADRLWVYYEEDATKQWVLVDCGPPSSLADQHTNRAAAVRLRGAHGRAILVYSKARKSEKRLISLFSDKWIVYV